MPKTRGLRWIPFFLVNYVIDFLYCNDRSNMGALHNILLYSSLLIVGLIVSQSVDLSPARGSLSTLTLICLAYIMIEVGLEFVLDKRRLKKYGADYLVAATAAAFPWIFCATYFMAVFGTGWKEALLIGRFAAPTSAGVLFAMLGAAGLAATWLFKKARILAIFDDLDTVLFMIPLQVLFVGWKMELLAVGGIIIALLVAAYRWLHTLRWPVGRGWLLLYGGVTVLLCRMLENAVHIHVEVLLPAFTLGGILFNPHDPNQPNRHLQEHAYLEPENKPAQLLDRGLKASFMFLVGCSLPRIELAAVPWGMVFLHVTALTLLSNIGKCFPLFCYRQEASLRQRLALSIAMFPRGEVGAGVLLVAIGYRLTGLPLTLSALSLALNLVLTGVFIAAVKWLIREELASQ